MESLEWEPAQTTKIEFCEVLREAHTEDQIALLFRTCSQYAKTYEWTSAGDLTPGQKRSVRTGHATDHTLGEPCGSLSAKKAGRLLYLYLASEENAEAFVETWNADHGHDPSKTLEAPDF